MPERTPHQGIPATDPEQLALGEFEGAALVPLGAGSEEAGAEDGGPTFREPPVCGEWSYDATDEADSRASAMLGTPPLAQLISTPQAPVTIVSRPAASVPTVAGEAPPAPAASLRSAVPSAVPSGGLSAGAPAGTPAPRGPATGASPVRVTRTPLFSRSLTPPTPLPALTELRSIHDAHPGSAKTAIDLANALDKRGNIEGALNALQRSIDAGADVVALRCARARLLSGRLRYDDAEAELRHAAKANPDDLEVLLQQGILACRRAKWREAVEPLEKVARLDPRSSQAQFYLGEALSKIDRLEGALACYQRAAELEPANYRALKGVGIVLDRMGRPADAAEFYRRARDAQGT